MTPLFKINLDRVEYSYSKQLGKSCRCEACGAYLLPSLPVRRIGRIELKHDLALSDDGALIVSEAARELFSTESRSRIDFYAISGNAYRMVCRDILWLDRAESGISLIDKCQKCGLYENQVWNAKCVFRNCEAIEADGAYSCDTLFGWKPALSPMLFVGEDLRQKAARSLRLFGMSRWKYDCS